MDSTWVVPFTVNHRIKKSVTWFNILLKCSYLEICLMPTCRAIPSQVLELQYEINRLIDLGASHHRCKMGFSIDRLRIAQALKTRGQLTSGYRVKHCNMLGLPHI